MEKTVLKAESREVAYRVVTKHLLPVLFSCYILSYIDRVNVGFAKLQMQQDLGMSDSIYGMAAGVFFIGYVLFEVPANLMLQRIGARRWLGTIMVLWGLTSVSTMFVRNPLSFYALRFLLGVMEAGFFPGVMLYLTLWYPRRYRASMVAAFMTAIPLSGVASGLASGWILSHLASAGGLRGWQWLFLLEGLPSVVAGLASMRLLVNGPADAPWLSEDQKLRIAADLRQEEAKKREGQSSHRLRDAFASRPVWLLCAIFFGLVVANYGVTFWLPQMIADTLTRDPLRIGLLSMIPWSVGAAAMVVSGRHSDATGERVWHVAVAGLVAGAAFGLCTLPGLAGEWRLAVLTCAIAGIMAACSTFWSLPTEFLSSTAAAAGIALINSVGSIAGYVSPFLVGRTLDATHSMTVALWIFAGSSVAASLLVPYVRVAKTSGRPAGPPVGRSYVAHETARRRSASPM